MTMTSNCVFLALVGSLDQGGGNQHRNNPDVQDRDGWPAALTAGPGDWVAVSAQHGEKRTQTICSCPTDLALYEQNSQIPVLSGAMKKKRVEGTEQRWERSEKEALLKEWREGEKEGSDGCCGGERRRRRKNISQTSAQILRDIKELGESWRNAELDGPNCVLPWVICAQLELIIQHSWEEQPTAPV